MEEALGVRMYVWSVGRFCLSLGTIWEWMHRWSDRWGGRRKRCCRIGCRTVSRSIVEYTTYTVKQVRAVNPAVALEFCPESQEERMVVGAFAYMPTDVSEVTAVLGGVEWGGWDGCLWWTLVHCRFSCYIANYSLVVLGSSVRLEEVGLDTEYGRSDIHWLVDWRPRRTQRYYCSKIHQQRGLGEHGLLRWCVICM